MAVFILIQSIHLSIHPSIYIQSSSLLSSIRPPRLYRPSIHNSSESHLPFIYPPLIRSSTIQLIYHPFPAIPSKIHNLFSPTIHLNKPSTHRPFNIHNLSFTHQPSIYPVSIPSSTLYTILLHPTTIYHPLPIFPQSTLLYPSIHHLWSSIHLSIHHPLTTIYIYLPSIICLLTINHRSSIHPPSVISPSMHPSTIQHASITHYSFSIHCHSFTVHLFIHSPLPIHPILIHPRTSTDTLHHKSDFFL